MDRIHGSESNPWILSMDQIHDLIHESDPWIRSLDLIHAVCIKTMDQIPGSDPLITSMGPIHRSGSDPCTGSMDPIHGFDAGV